MPTQGRLPVNGTLIIRAGRGPGGHTSATPLPQAEWVAVAARSVWVPPGSNFGPSTNILVFSILVVWLASR
jgi:hypothetical protein